MKQSMAIQMGRRMDTGPRLWPWTAGRLTATVAVALAVLAATDREAWSQVVLAEFEFTQANTGTDAETNAIAPTTVDPGAVVSSLYADSGKVAFVLPPNLHVHGCDHRRRGGTDERRCRQCRCGRKPA
jgi:hypothetical protein